MRALGIIPARAGSKRIPGKNTRDFCGKPLVQWVIEAAQRSKLLNGCWTVSTDIPELLSDIYLVDHRFRRPEHLTGDDVPMADVVRHILERCTANGWRFDAFCVIQPTSPLTIGADIDACIELISDIPGRPSCATTICGVPHMLHKDKQFPGEITDGEEPLKGIGCRTASMEFRTCGVYASTVKAFEQSGQILSGPVSRVVVPLHRAVDINDEEDWAHAEALMQYQLRRKAINQWGKCGAVINEAMGS